MDWLKHKITTQNIASPVNLLIIVALFFVATQTFIFSMLNKQIFVGLDIFYDYEYREIIIEKSTSEHHQSPTPLPGTELLTISVDNKSIQLNDDITIWPHEKNNISSLNEFFDKHEAIYRILLNSVVIANKGETNEFEIKPYYGNAMNSLKWEFWSARLSNMLALLICVFVWIYKPYKKESFFMLLSGITYYMFGVFYSITLGKELTLPPDILKFSVYAQVLFLNLFAMSFFLLLTNYPNQILSKRIGIAFAAIVAFLTANYFLQLFNIPIHFYFSQFLVLYLIAIIIALLQWRKSNKNPVNKAANIVLQLSMLMPTGIIIFFYFIPISLNERALIPHIYTHLLLLLIYIGWTISILRFRLFEFERWWFKSWIWLICGFFVIAIDLFFLYIFDWSEEISITTSIIIVSFIYFPLRQSFFLIATSYQEPPITEKIAHYFEKTKNISNMEDYDEKWKVLLIEIYKPVDVCTIYKPLVSESLSENGLYLSVRSLTKDYYYHLAGKDYGNRLFQKDDITYCNTLFKALLSITESNIAHQRIKLIERKRVMHDLHDNLGALLLTMSHSCESEADREQSRSALRLLRDTVYFSNSTADIQALDVLSRCRLELDGRLQGMGLSLNWKNNIDKEISLSAKEGLALSCILREAFTNAIKYTSSPLIQICCANNTQSLSITIINSTNKIDSTSNWIAGTGMASIKRRCCSVGANANWRVMNSTVTFSLTLSLKN